jgi:hypothetical protein
LQNEVTIQGSGFEAKKQAIFRQSSLLFEGDAAHRLKKEAQDGGKLTFLDQNVSTLNRYKTNTQKKEITGIEGKKLSTLVRFGNKENLPWS